MAFCKWSVMLVALLAMVGSSGVGCSQAQPAKSGATAQAPFMAYSAGKADVVIASGGDDYLTFGWAMWGPNWAWTGLDGTTRSENGVATGELGSKLGGSNVPVKLNFRASRTAPRILKLEYSVQAETDTGTTMMVATINPGKAFEGREAQVTTGGQLKPVRVPFEKSGLGEKVQTVQLTDSAGRVTTLRFDPAIDITSDGAARVLLAKDHLKAGDVRRVAVTVELPANVQWFAGLNEIPDEPGLANWYPWQGTGQADDSFLAMADWSNAPAGQFGRVTRQGSQLIYNGRPLKLWGLNLSFGATAPEKSLADKRAGFYRRYGINAVRLHKWADGSGWAGILKPDTAVEFDPAALDRMDYQVAKLKEAGIFTKLSATFGSLKLGSADKKFVPWMEEFGAFRDGRIETPHSAIHYSPELQQVQIAQMVNLLKHKNAYTGFT